MIKFSLQRIRALVKKELIQLRRDKITLRMIVLLPVIQLLLFGYAINTDPRHLPTAVISRDNTFLTRAFVAALKNSDYFEFAGEFSSDAAGEDCLRRGEAVFVVTIPDDFTQKVLRGERPEILIQADASDPSTIAGTVGSLTGIVSQVIERELTGTLAHLKGVPAAFSVVVQKSYNPEGFTRYNIIPGLIGMVLIFTCVMMTALALTRERERGTMENLLAMPVGSLEVMIGKITPFIFIGLFQVAIILVISCCLFDVPVIGSLSLLVACCALFIVCNLIIGFLISALAKNQTQALQMSIFVLLPSLMLSGFMFPFQGMPVWAQCIGNCIPLTHFARISRGIMLKGATVADILPQIFSLVVLILAVSLIATKVYKKTLD